MVPLVTRAEWGARPPTSSQTTVPWSRRLGVTVHYTASSRDATPRDIQAYAQNTVGHSDIHYNLLVDWRGVAYEGRGWTIAAAHSEGENTTHVGIAFIGMDTDVTPAAEATIAALIADANTLAGRQLPELKGHQEMPGANTSCPGQRLMALVRRLREGGVDDMSEWSERDPFGPDPDGHNRTPAQKHRDTYAAVFFGKRPVDVNGKPIGPEPWITAQITGIRADIAKLAVPPPAQVDITALVAALRPELEAAADRAVRKALGGLDNPPTQ